MTETFNEELVHEKIARALDLVIECSDTCQDPDKSKDDLRQASRKAIVALVHCIDLQSGLINEIVTTQQQLALYMGEGRVIG